jgi:hypothetical protein
MWRQEVFPEVEKSITFLFYNIFALNVATAKTLSPQKWQMWQQEHFGWTALL